MSDYPVGATWVGKGNGKVGMVSLSQKDGNIEIWKWWSIYDDGSGLETDFTTSKAKAVDQCKQTMSLSLFSSVIRASDKIIFRRTEVVGGIKKSLVAKISIQPPRNLYFTGHKLPTKVLTMSSTQSTLNEIYYALKPSYEGFPKKAIYQTITDKLNDLAGEDWTENYISSVLTGSLTSVGETFERTVRILWENMHGTPAIKANTEEVAVFAKPGTVHERAIILTESRQCKNPACTVHFIPKQSTQTYCEPACRKFAWRLRKEVKK